MNEAGANNVKEIICTKKYIYVKWLKHTHADIVTNYTNLGRVYRESTPGKSMVKLTVENP